MIVNSKFSSIYLGRKEQWRASFDQDVCYVQKFAIDEEIRIQFVGYTSGFTAKYISDQNIETPINVEALLIDEGFDGKILYEVVFTIDKVGIYKFILTNGSEEVSTIINILPVEDLKNTVLISYTHRRNEYDTIFIDKDGYQKIFNLRVEGGFYPGDKTQAVENEMFRDQRFNPFQIASESYEVSVLTIGTKKGVPQWIGNKLNNIFNLSDILVDGIETTRNESSIPELISLSTYYPLYVFKIKVEQPDEDRIYNTISNRLFDRTHNGSFN